MSANITAPDKNIPYTKDIKDFRSKKHLTQQQIAIKLDVSPSYYIKVEQGIAKAGRGFIEKFVKAFPEESIDMFFGGVRK